MKLKCINCGKSTPLLAQRLGYCADCIRSNPFVAKEILERVHAKSRAEFNLPPHPPKASDGISCRICVNEYRIPDGGRGYCGLRLNKSGKLIHLGGTPKVGIVSWYFGPLPTNCFGTGKWANIAHLLGNQRQHVLTATEADGAVIYRKQALACLEVAKEQGLTNVRLGNLHLFVGFDNNSESYEFTTTKRLWSKPTKHLLS